ncbi:MAG: hypothetical protein M0R80_17465 [Proteobacteria bacterium]|jgi:hypothetical protein|nr:hypothetical protein [Pseudomonadota bacterium]
MADEIAETGEVEETTPLEEIEVSLEDLKDMEESDNEAEETEEETETAEEDESTESEDTTEEASEEESEEEDESQRSDEEAQKQHNREMAEKRIQEKRLKEAGIKKQLDEYVAEADDETTLAVRQLQVEAYKTKVERNEGLLKNQYEKAMNDFPILRNASPEIQAEIDQALDTFQALSVTIDAWGNPSDVRGDLYEALKTKANSIEKLTAIGAKRQEGDKSKSKANALTPPSRTPKAPKSDPDIDAFNEEAYGKE